MGPLDFVRWQRMKIFRVIGVLAAGGLYVGACRSDVVPPDLESAEVLYSSGTIGTGGSLSDVLGRAGISPAEASLTQLALKPHVNPKRMKPRDRYEIHQTTTSKLLQLTYWPNNFEFFMVRPSTAGTFIVVAEKVRTTEVTMGASGRIQVSLWDAMTAQGVPPEMIYRFADLFGWRIDFLTEPRAGDTYKLIWKRSNSPQAHQDRDIVCALYHGKETGVVYAFRFGSEYFDEKGDSLRGEFLRAPLAYRRISSRYTHARFHPILRYWRPHHGIDYAAARGTPVVSIGDGTVISKGYHGGLGNQIRIRHAGSYVSIYGHLMGFARGLHVGSSVRQGQVVGYVGSTGLSTGPHLHLGLERSGQMINFITLKSSLKRRSVAAFDRERYREMKKFGFSLFAQLPAGGSAVKELNPSSSLSARSH